MSVERLHVGDKVRVRYRESILVTQRPPGETAASAMGVVGAGRTAAGE